MRIHHLNCGSIAPPSRRLVNGTGSWLAAGNIVCHCLLIETDDGLVLVDTGMGFNDIERPYATLGWHFLWVMRPRLLAAETAASQVLALGYDTRDVRHIVLTHLDIDHAGGIADFPNAQIHVHSVELESARNPATLLERQRFNGNQWAHNPKWVEHSAEGERWFGFEAARELPGLPPEFLLIPLGGHTRGHSGIAIDTGRTDRPRWLLHAGDAFFFHGQLLENPYCSLGTRAFQHLMQSDKTSRLHNVRRLRELAISHPEVQVISAHDPVDLENALKQPEVVPLLRAR